MDLYFYLWLIMSACWFALLIVNRKKQKMIDEYKSLLQKYGKGCNETDDVGKLKENIESADKLIKEQEENIESADKLIKEQEESIKSADKLIKEQDEIIKDLQRRCRKYVDTIEEIKKLTADFTPMKSMADYTDKIQKFSEQAEDMFGLYIDSVHLERANSMLSRFWTVDMKTSGNKKPKKGTE
jgi:chromosome segregation ATPase